MVPTLGPSQLGLVLDADTLHRIFFLWFFVVNRGDCATCEISLAGRRTKPCVAKVPKAPTLKSLQEKGLEIRG